MKLIARLAVVTLLPAVLFLTANRPVFAGSSVDPNTLNPPPATMNVPPGTVFSCTANGPNIICQGTFAVSGNNVDRGAYCAGVDPSYTFDMHESYKVTYNYTQWYNAHGDITRGHVHVTVNADWINAENGIRAQVTSGYVDALLFATPADWNTVTEPLTGDLTKVSVHGGGTVFQDAGRLVFLYADGSLGFHGHFDSLELGLDSGTALCQGLAR